MPVPLSSAASIVFVMVYLMPFVSWCMRLCGEFRFGMGGCCVWCRLS